MNLNKVALHTLLFVALSGPLLQPMAAPRKAPETRDSEQVIRITASMFEFAPSEITVKQGVPVVLEFVSKDRHHGFNLPGFHVQADIQPGVVQKIRFVPDKAGDFTFFCDVFCGDGHEDMSGVLRVRKQ